MIPFFLNNWRSLLWSGSILAAAIALGFIARTVFFWMLREFDRRKGDVIGHSLINHDQGATRWIFPLIAVLCVLPGLPLPPMLMSALEHIVGIGLIAAIAWLIILLVDVTSDIMAAARMLPDQSKERQLFRKNGIITPLFLFFSIRCGRKRRRFPAQNPGVLPSNWN